MSGLTVVTVADPVPRKKLGVQGPLALIKQLTILMELIKLAYLGLKSNPHDNLNPMSLKTTNLLCYKSNYNLNSTSTLFYVFVVSISIPNPSFNDFKS